MTYLCTDEDISFSWRADFTNAFFTHSAFVTFPCPLGGSPSFLLRGRIPGPSKRLCCESSSRKFIGYPALFALTAQSKSPAERPPAAAFW